MKKTIIKLHGKLAHEIGSEFEFFNIRKPADALFALETRFPHLRKQILSLSKIGEHYEILVNNQRVVGNELNKNISNIERIDIIPSVMGQFFKGALVNFFIGLGISAGVATVLATVAVTFAISLAVGLIIAGIAYLLTPIPETEPNEAEISQSIKNASFTFQTPQNSSAQGRPIPIIYGRLRVGSLVVGTTITNYELSQDTQQNVKYDNINTEALLKLQDAFGSSTSAYIRGY